MKKIICLMRGIALFSLSSVSCQVFASNEFCLASNNDCTFVLLSETVQETFTELIADNSDSKQNLSHKANKEEVIQSSLVSENNETLLIVNEARAKQPFSPLSTFKIASSLIALDSKLIADAQQSLVFDKSKYPAQPWWPSTWKRLEYNLYSAFKASVVPIYRQMATDIGSEKMQHYVSSFSYGNEDISSGLDDFWLNGSLKISALQQVEFLQKIHNGQLTISQQSIDILEDIMLIESKESYAMYAKTGTSKVTGDDKSNTSILAWYVGFVVNTEGVHYFAFNFTRKSYAKLNEDRVSITRNHLKRAGVI